MLWGIVTHLWEEGREDPWGDFVHAGEEAGEEAADGGDFEVGGEVGDRVGEVGLVDDAGSKSVWVWMDRGKGKKGRSHS